MGLLDAATTAAESVSRTLDSISPASALAGVASSVSSAISSVGNVVSNILSPVGLNLAQIQAQLPLPNPLSVYASYNYIFTISVLDDDSYNFPDKSYLQGRTATGSALPIILRSGSGDPDNRINTIYGKFDFFVDDLVIESIIGWEKNNNTNATNLSFRVIEPYSMGLFLMSIQQAAYQVGHKNWKDAPFLFTIEFLGANQLGIMQKVPNTKRCIPFKFTDLVMSADVNGSRYDIKALPYNEVAFGKNVASLKNDSTVAGTTVQEALQTGEKSLQAVINARYKQMVKDKLVEEADEIVILFPVDVSSGGGGGAGSEEGNDSATTSGGGGVENKLGVSRSSDNGTLVQKKDQVNAIGQAKLGFDTSRKGVTPIAKDNKVYDTTSGIFKRGNITIDPSSSDFKFRQDTDVVNAINQIIMISKYAEDALKPANRTPEGFIKWWRVEAQVYNKTSDANLTTTGVKPKIYVYRVVSYNAHASKVAPANVEVPGFPALKKQVVKKYDYIYMGTNTEVLKFEIQYSGSFTSTMAADGGLRSSDVVTSDQNAASDNKDPNLNPLPKGDQPPPPSSGGQPTQTAFNVLKTTTDLLGGGGPDTQATRAARLFHDAITQGVDMQNLELEILGDPYFIAQSGMGNYNSQATNYSNLNSDGTVNYQNGEVDVEVQFRTPTDINQLTGLYKFPTSSGVAQFCGLYDIKNVTSTFRGGQFKQVLKGFRRKGQPGDNPNSAPSIAKTISSINPSAVKIPEMPITPGAPDDLKDFYG